MQNQDYRWYYPNMIKINDNWIYTSRWDQGFDESVEVRLPHNPITLPLHYSTPEYYEMVSGYKKTIVLEEEDLSKRIFLTLTAMP